MTASPDERSSGGESTSRGGWILAAIVVLGISIRLYNIGGPPLDHHWVRQYDTAAIALNFAEPGATLWMPKVDWGGDTPGYAQTEFPLYQYVVGSLYRVFGAHEAIARGVNVALYAAVAWILFGVGQRLYGRRAALIAVAVFSFGPLGWFFTRTIQPDTMALLGGLVAVAGFWRWTEHGSWWDFAASLAGLTVACLIKPTNLCLGLPLLYLGYQRFGTRLVLQPALWGLAVVVFGGVGAWFAHANSLWETYGNTLYAAYTFPDFPSRIVGYSLGILDTFIQLIPTPFGLAFVFVGAVAPQPGKNTLVLWWLAATLAPALLIADQFSGHDYYFLPIVLPAALLFGYGVDALLRAGLVHRWVVVGTCAAAFVVSIWVVRDWLAVDSWHEDRVAFGKVINRATPPDDLVIAVSIAAYRPGWYQRRMPDGRYLYHDAVDLYLSDRHGWSVGSQQLTPELVEELRERGATHLFYMLNDEFTMLLPEHPPIRDYLLANYSEVDVGPGGALYRLAPAREPGS